MRRLGLDPVVAIAAIGVMARKATPHDHHGPHGPPITVAEAQAATTLDASTARLALEYFCKAMD